MERVVRIFRSPEEAEAMIRQDYAKMSPDERVALTVELMRRYYASDDAPGRLPRVLTMTRRAVRSGSRPGSEPSSGEGSGEEVLE